MRAIHSASLVTAVMTALIGLAALGQAATIDTSLSSPTLRRLLECLVFAILMPQELEDRGISAAATTCQTIMEAISKSADPIETGSASSSGEVFT